MFWIVFFIMAIIFMALFNKGCIRFKYIPNKEQNEITIQTIGKPIKVFWMPLDAEKEKEIQALMENNKDKGTVFYSQIVIISIKKD
jgi:hypothetical protein